MAVTPKTRLVLWTQAGGRCQFPGCNISLLGDLASGQADLNKAYVAHIVAESPGGPRGDPIRSPALADDITNLMLLCDPHHRLIDGPSTRGDFPEDRLREMKRVHEARIALVTGIPEERATHVLFYAARVGQHGCAVDVAAAQRALLPDHFMAEADPITLELKDAALFDNEEDYWRFQEAHLRRQFAERAQPRLASGAIARLAVFAIAPQPLLVRLGTLLSDIPTAAVQQLHREPSGWGWRVDRPAVDFQIGRPERIERKIALKLPISATINDDRIHAVLGVDTSIWSVETPSPHNDIMHRADDLRAFRQAMRKVFNDIKAAHGEDAEINVFPAVPVSAAVEIGRVWMPKADLALHLYDQNRSAGGFVRRLSIGADPGNKQ